MYRRKRRKWQVIHLLDRSTYRGVIAAQTQQLCILRCAPLVSRHMCGGKQSFDAVLADTVCPDHEEPAHDGNIFHKHN